MKKILAMMLILVMAFTFVGCGKESAADQVKTPQELMDKIMDASGTQKSGEFKGNFELNMSGLEEMGLAGPMSLEMTGKVADEKNMSIDMKVDPGIGMVIDASLYLNDEQMLIYAPMLGQFMGYSYLSMDMASVSEMAGTDINAQEAAKVMEVLKKFEDETEYSIYDVIVLNENLKEEKVKINGEDVDTTKLVMNVKLDKAMDLVVAFLEFVAEDEDARGILMADMSQEDIDMMLESIHDPDTRAEVDAALEGIDIKTFEVEYYVNSDFVPVKMDLNADMNISAEGEELSIQLTGSFEFFNIGKVEKIEMPEVDPAEVMDMTDMMGIY
ncbi:MAG: hypothetical protein JXR88_09595 [Clostridia bacterium]|nr:hypothetical protein [Clostridia bacterium]